VVQVVGGLGCLAFSLISILVKLDLELGMVTIPFGTIAIGKGIGFCFSTTFGLVVIWHIGYRVISITTGTVAMGKEWDI